MSFNSSTALTWIAILPLTPLERLKRIDEILCALRFIEHGTFIIYLFISNKSKHNNPDTIIFYLQYYAAISYVFVVLFYVYITFCSGAIAKIAVSRNRTLKQLLKLELYEEIVQMETFGYLYSEQDWKDVANNANDKTWIDNIFWDTLQNNHRYIALHILNAKKDATNIRTQRLGKKIDYTPLMYACDKGYPKIVSKLIDHDSNVNVNEQTRNGDTALIWAAEKGWDRIVETLLDANANVDIENQNGDTALMRASWKGHSKVVRHLINARADVNSKNKDGDTPLILGATRGKRDIVEQLIEAGASVNDKGNKGDTGLLRAARKGYEQVVELLIEHGADVNESNQDGNSPLMVACSEWRTYIVQLLIDKNANVNQINQDKYTPLMFAVERDQQHLGLWQKNGDEVEVIGKLINANADLNMKNRFGQTAKDMARNKGAPTLLTDAMTTNGKQ